MTKRKLLKRFKYLSNVLNKSRNLGYFNDGQRTCLHRERAAIYQAIDVIEAGSDGCTLKYSIPSHLEKKCSRVKSDFKISQ